MTRSSSPPSVITSQSLIQLPNSERDWHLFTHGLQPLARYGVTALGVKRITTLLLSQKDGTIFSDIVVSSKEIKFYTAKKPNKLSSDKIFTKTRLMAASSSMTNIFDIYGF